MMIEKLKTLKDMGLYSELVKAGIIPIKVNYFLEISIYYNKMLILNEGKKMQSLTDTSEAFKCSESTVKRAIKLMK